MLLHNWYEVSAGHSPVTYQSSVSSSTYSAVSQASADWFPHLVLLYLSLGWSAVHSLSARVNVETQILILILNNLNLWLLSPAPAPPAFSSSLTDGSLRQQ